MQIISFIIFANVCIVFQRRKTSKRTDKAEVHMASKSTPSNDGMKKPQILIFDGDSLEDCPGSHHFEPVEFCGHGLRNAMGTTFHLKTNFNPCISRANLESVNDNGLRSGALDVATKGTSKGANLTMPQLKQLRQASMSITSLNEPGAWKTADQRVLSSKPFTGNPCYLNEDKDMVDKGVDDKSLDNIEQVEPCPKPSSVIKFTPDYNPKICVEALDASASLGSSSTRPESDNYDDVYQLREVAISDEVRKFY